MRGRVHSRNIVAYDGKVRQGQANSSLLAEYLLSFGTCLFDRLYYYASNLEVKLSGVDPLEHYLTEGWRAGAQPREDFDVDLYVREIMGGKADLCPLIHAHRYPRDFARAAARAVPVETANRFGAESFEIDAILARRDDFCPQKVARALRSRIDWERFSAPELAEMTVE